MYEDVRKKIVEIGMKLEEYGLNVGSSGNISARLPNDLIAITPSGLVKSRLRPEDIIITDLDGSVIEGKGKPSTEMPMHLAIYKARKDVEAIIHCHPVYATVFASIGRDIPVFLEEMAIYIGGPIKVAKFAKTGSEELAKNVVEALEFRKAVLLANHGLVAVGRDLDEAFEIAYRVERVAKIYALALLLGGPKLIPEDVVEEEIRLYKLKNELE